jgi:hypothetical protein
VVDVMDIVDVVDIEDIMKSSEPHPAMALVTEDSFLRHGVMTGPLVQGELWHLQGGVEMPERKTQRL